MKKSITYNGERMAISGVCFAITCEIILALLQQVLNNPEWIKPAMWISFLIGVSITFIGLTKLNDKKES